MSCRRPLTASSRRALLPGPSAWDRTLPLGDGSDHLRSRAPRGWRAQPHPELAPEACVRHPICPQSWAAAPRCNTNTHTIIYSPHNEGGWTPASQTNPAKQPAIHRHPIWPGKAFLHFCLDRLPFLVTSGRVYYDKEPASAVPQSTRKATEGRGVSLSLG